MEARMALAAILKDCKFVQTPDTEVSRNQSLCMVMAVMVCKTTNRSWIKDIYLVMMVGNL